MNKIITLSITTALSAFLLVGCSGTPDAPDTKTFHSSSETSSVEAHAAKLHGHLTQEKLSSIVQKAGEKAGWKMTEFKSDKFIAEKTDDGETESVTIKFDKYTLEISPENNDLLDDINEALAR